MSIGTALCIAKGTRCAVHGHWYSAVLGYFVPRGMWSNGFVLRFPIWLFSPYMETLSTSAMHSSHSASRWGWSLPNPDGRESCLQCVSESVMIACRPPAPSAPLIQRCPPQQIVLPATDRDGSSQRDATQPHHPAQVCLRSQAGRHSDNVPDCELISHEPRLDFLLVSEHMVGVNIVSGSWANPVVMYMTIWSFTAHCALVQFLVHSTISDRDAPL